jgi:hypothetical protein
MTLPAAIVAFLSAGMVPPPPRAAMVRALATARLSVASYRHRQTPLAAWLAGEIRVGGLRENAAMLAVLEAPEDRGKAAQDYLRRHPSRAAHLHDLLAADSHEIRAGLDHFLQASGAMTSSRV